MPWTGCAVARSWLLVSAACVVHGAASSAECYDLLTKDGKQWHMGDKTTYFNCAEFYTENPETNCKEFGGPLNYNSEGVGAKDACCVCGGGTNTRPAHHTPAPQTCWDRLTSDGKTWYMGDKTMYYNCKEFFTEDPEVNCKGFSETVNENHEGVSAKQACCVCGGGQDTDPEAAPKTPAPAQKCWDKLTSHGKTWHMGDKHSYYNCKEFYEVNPNNCKEFGLKVNEDEEGVGPVEACCVCGGGQPTPPEISTTCWDRLTSDGKTWYMGDKTSYYSCKEFYEQDPEYNCKEFSGKVNENHEGVSARDACCVCGGGSNVPRSPAPPTDVPETPYPPADCYDLRTNKGDEWFMGNFTTYYNCEGLFLEDQNACANEGNNWGTGNLTANQVCCRCGGGSKDPPTPPVCEDLKTSEGLTWYMGDRHKLYSCVEFYEKYPERCHTHTLANADGVSAPEACCVCGGGRVPDTAAPTTAVPKPPCYDLLTSEGEPFHILNHKAWYNCTHFFAEKSAERCASAGGAASANAEGMTAQQACCVCGGGSPYPATPAPQASTVQCHDLNNPDGTPFKAHDLDMYACSYYESGTSLKCSSQGGRDFANEHGLYPDFACCACGGGWTGTDAPDGQTLAPLTHGPDFPELTDAPPTDAPETRTPYTDSPPGTTPAPAAPRSPSPRACANLQPTYKPYSVDSAGKYTCDVLSQRPTLCVMLQGRRGSGNLTVSEACCACGGGNAVTDVPETAVPDTDVPTTAIPETTEPAPVQPLTETVVMWYGPPSVLAQLPTELQLKQIQYELRKVLQGFGDGTVGAVSVVRSCLLPARRSLAGILEEDRTSSLCRPYPAVTPMPFAEREAETEATEKTATNAVLVEAVVGLSRLLTPVEREAMLDLLDKKAPSGVGSIGFPPVLATTAHTLSFPPVHNTLLMQKRLEEAAMLRMRGITVAKAAADVFCKARDTMPTTADLDDPAQCTRLLTSGANGAGPYPVAVLSVTSLSTEADVHVALAKLGDATGLFQLFDPAALTQAPPAVTGGGSDGSEGGLSPSVLYGGVAVVVLVLGALAVWGVRRAWRGRDKTGGRAGDLHGVMPSVLNEAYDDDTDEDTQGLPVHNALPVTLKAPQIDTPPTPTLTPTPPGTPTLDLAVATPPPAAISRNPLRRDVSFAEEES